MKRLIIFLLLFAAIKVAGQTTGYLRFDTVKIMKQNGTCELYIINATKDSLGLLTNVGGGLTQFRKSRVLNDSTIVVGLDTLVIVGGVGGGGGSGSVTSISQGYGIVNTPNPITSTGTIEADTFNISTRAWRQKLADSLGALITAGGGINQLTGQVTAGPGTGSQVATIATNTVSNANLRQSAANSVIGRASNSTGNVADIAAATNSTYLQFDGTDILFDSVDFGHIKNAPPIFPGMYIAPAQSFNPGFLVFATGIARPSNSFSHGTPITWEFLTASTLHNYSFFDSVYGHASNSRLVVRYPQVKNVINTTITPDETFSGQIQTVGPSVGVTTFEAPVYRYYSMGIRLTGAGTNTWTKTSTSPLNPTGNFDVSTYSTSDGSTSFNVTATYGTDYNAINLTYIGANNYHIRRTYSGLGGYSAKFHLVDEFNNPVTSNPTTSDEIIMSNAGILAQQVSMSTWNATTNSWMGSGTNFWIWAAFEAWIVAAPVSSTAIQVRYQTVYPSATNYKIYRATSLYGAETLIHTGTTGMFTDGGLTANTVYYYKMYATISGVDTYITYFRTNTYF